MTTRIVFSMLPTVQFSRLSKMLAFCTHSFYANTRNHRFVLFENLFKCFQAICNLIRRQICIPEDEQSMLQNWRNLLYELHKEICQIINMDKRDNEEVGNNKH